MADKALPSPEVLRQLLRYEPETGKLFWRNRSHFYFSNTRDQTHSMRLFNATFSGKEALTAVDGAGYRGGRILGAPIKAHRVIVAMETGCWPADVVDHINGNRLDNRIINLRNATATDNARNARRRSDNTTGISGVSLHKPSGKYRAYYHINGKTISCGYHHTIEDAAAARSLGLQEAEFSPTHGRAGEFNIPWRETQ